MAVSHNYIVSDHRSSINIRDIVSGGLTTVENTGLVKCIAILNSNFRIVIGHDDGSINVWEPDTGKLLTTLLGHTGQVRYVVISPNDFRIVSASAHEIMMWDTFTYAKHITRATKCRN
jgi:WD40 repeat protein